MKFVIISDPEINLTDMEYKSFFSELSKIFHHFDTRLTSMDHVATYFSDRYRVTFVLFCNLMLMHYQTSSYIYIQYVAEKLAWNIKRLWNIKYVWYNIERIDFKIYVVEIFAISSYESSKFTESQTLSSQRFMLLLFDLWEDRRRKELVREFETQDPGKYCITRRCLLHEQKDWYPSPL